MARRSFKGKLEGTFKGKFTLKFTLKPFPIMETADGAEHALDRIPQFRSDLRKAPGHRRTRPAHGPTLMGPWIYL